MKFILKLLGLILLKFDSFISIFEKYKKIIFKYKLANIAVIGKGVTIHHSVYIRSPKGLEVGDNSNINHGCEFYCAGGIKIGANSMISYQVMILSDTRTYMGEKPLKGRNERILSPVIIGSDVWIGARSIIMPGVHIHNHSIVAAGSIVTKDVNPWEIVAGNPARVIKSRIEKKQQ